MNLSNLEADNPLLDQGQSQSVVHRMSFQPPQVKPGSTRLAREDSELLAEGEVLKDEMLSGAQGCAQGGAQEQEVGEQW